MEKPRKIVIIGGVAGGASAAARLRRLDERAHIVLLERGEYISFANCGLPYYVGGTIKEKSALVMQTPQSFGTRFNVDVRTLNEAVAVDPAGRSVSVKNVATGETYEESYDALIISTGAAPFVPPSAAVKSDRVFTLRTVPDALRMREFVTRAAPRRALVVGGGFIGVETAENLTEAGVGVTLIEGAEHIIPSLDYDTACEVQNHMRSKGVDIITDCMLDGLSEKDGALRAVMRVRGTEGAETLSGNFDMAVLAAGVRPDTGFAAACGILTDGRGAIITDEHMRTSADDIYAVGDAVAVRDFVTGAAAYVPLAGPANKQGRIAADNICGIPSAYKGTQGSSVLKVFDMTATSTGLSESAAKRAGIAYGKSYTYSSSHAGYYPGAANMSIKTLYDKKDGRILGVQIVGREGTDKRCDVMATAIRARMTAADLASLELCYAPPYGSAKDPVNMAGYAIENIITGKVRPFFVEDVDRLPRDGGAILLDVRTSAEYAMGHIDGFFNIPLDELRDRMSSLDAAKPVYVTCQVGLRGYIAARILMQNGFDVRNLSGGYRLYAEIKRNENAGCETVRRGDADASDGSAALDLRGKSCPDAARGFVGSLRRTASGQSLSVLTEDGAFAAAAEEFAAREGADASAVFKDGVIEVSVKKPLRHDD